MTVQRFRVLFFLMLSIGIISCVHGSNTDPTSIKKRLATIEKQVPLPYHDALVNDIKDYYSKQLPANFALFENSINEEIQHFDLPHELIYLPLALTNLQLDYNHDGRVGIWALPALVALRYGLKVDETHDERYTVEASSYAAVRYLTDLYEIYGDWWMCILAYVNSPTALHNVKLRHPEAGFDPWNYYNNGLLEESKIVSQFIACYYVYSSDDKSVDHTTEQYGYCTFDQPVSVSVASSIIGVQDKRIKSLNPAFLTDPIIPLEGYRLRLPMASATLFEANKSRIYEETKSLITKAEAQKAAVEKEKEKETVKPKESSSNCIIYTVKPGDTLGKIAKKHHVKISDLKKWNHLKGDLIRDNQKLKIYP